MSETAEECAINPGCVRPSGHAEDCYIGTKVMRETLVNNLGEPTYPLGIESAARRVDLALSGMYPIPETPPILIGSAGPQPWVPCPFFTDEQRRSIGVAISAEIDRIDRRIDAILRMRVEDAEPAEPEPNAGSDGWKGIPAEGRAWMDSPVFSDDGMTSTLNDLLRRAVAHGSGERLAMPHRENLRTARSAWLAGEVVEGRALSLVCDAIRKLLEIEDAIERGEGEA